LELHRAPADLVAQPPQERFVLGVQDRRPQQRSAGLVVAFEHRDVMSALRGHPSGLHARRCAADHHHLFGAGRARCGQRALLACAGVDRAVDRESLFHGVDAVFARDALANTVGATGGDLVRQVRVGEHRAPHRDEVGAPLGEDLLRALRIVDAADGDHRHVDDLLDGGGGADVERVTVGGGVDHAGHQPVDHAAADMERVDSRGHQLRCHLGGFEHRPTACDPFVAGDPKCDRQRVTDLGPDGGQRLEDHADAALHRVATVFVGTAVTLRRQKRAEEHVAMRGMQFDAVVPGFGRAPHRGLEQVEHLDQLLAGDLGRRPAVR